jgi:hypothetical protein
MTARITNLAISLCLMCGIDSVNAAVIWTARDSVLNASYLFGAAADVSSDNVKDTANSLTERFSMSIADSDTDAGVVLGQPWSAAIIYSAGHTFEVLGSPLNISGISSTGSSAATANYTGGASIGVNVRAPGNSWAVEFEVTTPTRYLLQGSVSDTNTRNTSAGVGLEQFGLRWGAFKIFTDNTSFYETGELNPGLYRVIANASAVAGLEIASAQSGWNLQLGFAPVPLPSAIWLFASVLGVWVSGRNVLRDFGSTKKPNLITKKI